jgi:hypothetical protein
MMVRIQERVKEGKRRRVGKKGKQQEKNYTSITWMKAMKGNFFHLFQARTKKSKEYKHLK